MSARYVPVVQKMYVFVFIFWGGGWPEVTNIQSCRLDFPIAAV